MSSGSIKIFCLDKNSGLFPSSLPPPHLDRKTIQIVMKITEWRSEKSKKVKSGSRFNSLLSLEENKKKKMLPRHIGSIRSTGKSDASTHI